jgi:hypothetical protein
MNLGLKPGQRQPLPIPEVAAESMPAKQQQILQKTSSAVSSGVSATLAPVKSPHPERVALAAPKSADSDVPPTQRAASHQKSQQWRCVSTSDPADHNGDAVLALAYCPQVVGCSQGHTNDSIRILFFMKTP